MSVLSDIIFSIIVIPAAKLRFNFLVLIFSIFNVPAPLSMSTSFNLRLLGIVIITSLVFLVLSKLYFFSSIFKLSLLYLYFIFFLLF